MTAGKDPHYARGLMRELAALDVRLAVIGDDELASADEVVNGLVDFHNLVGALDPRDTPVMKVWRVLSYYASLVMFAARTDAKIFHILWFRRFPRLERTALTAYFKLLRKKVVFTAHNVDDQARDGRRGRQASLRFLYRTIDHVFLHTEAMKGELTRAFAVPGDKVTVVPFGINDIIPVSAATRAEAKARLGFAAGERVLLFFGNIAPYKGLEDLVRAFADVTAEGELCTLVIAGRAKDRASEAYWAGIEQLIEELRVSARVRKEARYIADDEVGLFFRASDVVVLPYRRIYQSGVLALSYAQGRPVIVADVGSMREDVSDGETGMVFEGGSVEDLAQTIRKYFASSLFENLDETSGGIAEYGRRRFSWSANAAATLDVYRRLDGALR